MHSMRETGHQSLFTARPLIVYCKSWTWEVCTRTIGPHYDKNEIWQEKLHPRVGLTPLKIWHRQSQNAKECFKTLIVNLLEMCYVISSIIV